MYCIFDITDDRQSESTKRFLSPTPKQQTEILRACHPDIQGLLDLEQIFPYLNQCKLLTDTEREEMQSPINVYNRNQKITRLVEFLPRKGSDALQRFIECLKSSTDGTAHDELAEKLYTEAEQVLTRRKNNAGRYNDHALPNPCTFDYLSTIYINFAFNGVVVL